MKSSQLDAKHKSNRTQISAANLQIAICILQFAIILLAPPQHAFAAVRVEAYRGQPFGIGRVTIDLSPGSSTAPASDDRCAVGRR